jgi:hypothetical protein
MLYYILSFVTSFFLICIMNRLPRGNIGATKFSELLIFPFIPIHVIRHKII